MSIEDIATTQVGVPEKIPQKWELEMGMGGNSGQVPHKSKLGWGSSRSSRPWPGGPGVCTPHHLSPACWELQRVTMVGLPIFQL